MRFDEIRRALTDQGFVVYRDRNDSRYICDSNGNLVADQPGNEERVRDTVVVALVNAGFRWPWP